MGCCFPRRLGRTLRVTLVLSLAVTGACTEITTLKQQNPSEIGAGHLYVPENAELLVNSAIGDFQCAYLRYVVGSGLLSDELSNAITFTSSIDYDRRTIASSDTYGTGTCTAVQVPPIYTPLSVARASADTILAHLEEWTDEQVPNRQKLIGQAATYAGFSLVLLGEGMCSAAINVGPELQPAQLFTEARARFDKAIAAATAAGDAETLDLALLGRARTLLDLGDPAAAAADAALVPDGFASIVQTDAIDVRRQNMVFLHTVQSTFSTVDASFRGVTFGGVPDPRVAVTNTGFVGTTGDTIYQADKDAAIDAPIVLAKWSEAQLIIAEADVAAGNLDGAVAIINELHARAGIPAYNGSGATAAEVLAQIIEERRRELFLEGHRLGDIRRYDLPLDPPPGTTYPGGGTYGDQRCFPLPDVERINNPNIGNGS